MKRYCIVIQSFNWERASLTWFMNVMSGFRTDWLGIPSVDSLVASLVKSHQVAILMVIGEETICIPYSGFLIHCAIIALRQT